MGETMKGLHRTARCAEFTKEDIGTKVSVDGYNNKCRENVPEFFFK